MEHRTLDVPTPLEFDLVARLRAAAQAHGRADVVLGIGDDAAVLAVPAGRQLVVTTDTLNAGVHFPDDTAAVDVGWKSLAASLSDLAAMGADPAWCTLSLSLPAVDMDWFDGFARGFLECARMHGVALVGGDTVRGPLAVSVTAHGLVEAGCALRRDGARDGDLVWVSGTVGDAAGALREWQAGGPRDPVLQARLDRPTPRVGLGRALVGVASACVDVSDGLLADLGHVCRASGVGAELAVDALPWSETLRARFDVSGRRQLQAAGGDDYELCFTAPAALRDAVVQRATDAGVPVVRIGRIVAAEGIRAFDADGVEWQPGHAGHEHFATR